MSARRPPPRKSRAQWIALIVVALAAVYVWRVYYFGPRKASYPATAFHEVKRADMLISVTEEGALRALNETIVRSSLEGLNRIIHLVPEGTHVKKGELLVELDSAGLRDRLNEQELTYQDRLFQFLQAQGNLKIQKSLTESQIKDAELAVENAQDDLEKYRDGDAPLLIKTIEARSSVLNEQVRIATERYARTQDLFKTEKATRSELEADALSLKREQLALSQYQEDLRLIKKFDQPNQVRLLESKVQQAKDELDRLKMRTSNEIAQAEADLKTSERSIAFLEESLQTQKRRLENTKIFAPQDGLVVYAAVSPFQSMGGGDDRRRDESRFRGGRGGGNGGGDGEFRGGGRRGGRSGSTAASGSTSSSSGTAQTVSAANQRIASAISGTSGAQPGQATSAASGSSSSAGRSGGGGSGSQGSSSASSAFASYPSMRPSSIMPTANANSSAASGSSANSSSASANNSPSFSSSSSQFPSRSQNYQSFGYESYGTPGFLEEGVMVRQRQELIRLPDVSKMLAEIRIHESRVRQVRPGMTAWVRVENIPDRRFKGAVRRVAPLPDAQMSWMNPDLKVYPTDILVEDELPDLKPGVSARAEIVITNLTKVLSVPIQTVARLRGENVCFVQKGSGVAPVPVTTGWFNDRFVEITSGLKEGDRVLLAPASDEDLATESASTNEVDSAEQETAPPAQAAAEEPPPQARRMQQQRSNPEISEAGEAQPERRERQGGRGPRRPRNSETALE